MTRGLVIRRVPLRASWDFGLIRMQNHHGSIELAEDQTHPKVSHPLLARQRKPRQHMAAIMEMLRARSSMLLAANISNVRIARNEWFILIVGSCVVFTSFIWDYSRFLYQNISSTELKENSLSDKLFDLSIKYIPESFNWLLFVLGIIIISSGIFLLFIRNKKIVFLAK